MRLSAPRRPSNDRSEQPHFFKEGVHVTLWLVGLEQKYGLELQFFTNHIGHFILVTGLLGQLGDTGRVVMLSSRAHKMAPKEGIQFDNLSGSRDYNPWVAYGQSKLANLLFARALAHRLPRPQRTANAVHPGVIATNLARHTHFLARLGLRLLGPLFLKNVGEGAATQMWAAVHPDTARLRGEYLADCNLARPSRLAQDDSLAERLWLESERIVGAL